MQLLFVLHPSTLAFYFQVQYTDVRHSRTRFRQLTAVMTGTNRAFWRLSSGPTLTPQHQSSSFPLQWFNYLHAAQG
jgi:hypothetical protein